MSFSELQVLTDIANRSDFYSERESFNTLMRMNEEMDVAIESLMTIGDITRNGEVSHNQVAALEQFVGEDLEKYTGYSEISVESLSAFALVIIVAIIGAIIAILAWIISMLKGKGGGGAGGGAAAQTSNVQRTVIPQDERAYEQKVEALIDKLPIDKVIDAVNGGEIHDLDSLRTKLAEETDLASTLDELKDLNKDVTFDVQNTVEMNKDVDAIAEKELIVKNVADALKKAYDSSQDDIKSVVTAYRNYEQAFHDLLKANREFVNTSGEKQTWGIVSADFGCFVIPAVFIAEMFTTATRNLNNMDEPLTSIIKYVDWMTGTATSLVGQMHKLMEEIPFSNLSTKTRAVISVIKHGSENHPECAKYTDAYNKITDDADAFVDDASENLPKVTQNAYTLEDCLKKAFVIKIEDVHRQIASKQVAGFDIQALISTIKDPSTWEEALNTLLNAGLSNADDEQMKTIQTVLRNLKNGKSFNSGTKMALRTTIRLLFNKVVGAAIRKNLGKNLDQYIVNVPMVEACYADVERYLDHFLDRFSKVRDDAQRCADAVNNAKDKYNDDDKKKIFNGFFSENIEDMARVLMMAKSSCSLVADILYTSKSNAMSLVHEYKKAVEIFGSTMNKFISEVKEPFIKAILGFVKNGLLAYLS